MSRKVVSVFLMCVFFLFTACASGEVDDHTGEAITPAISSEQKGRNYQDVIADFEENGFKNIRTETIEDLITGWITEDGEVEQVSVDGDTGYLSGIWYPDDVEVIITYHTFSSNESATGEPSESTDPNEESTSEADSEILTIDNCADLAALLSIKDPGDPSVSLFAEKYTGKTIEFDGNVMSAFPHGDYDTRFDILLGAGDYDENSATGPNFQFSDVGAYDLGVDIFSIEDYIKVGTNLRIVAKVGSYDANSQLFSLDPISVKIR